MALVTLQQSDQQEFMFGSSDVNCSLRPIECTVNEETGDQTFGSMMSVLLRLIAIQPGKNDKPANS